jgi:hypothetical protein
MGLSLDASADRTFASNCLLAIKLWRAVTAVFFACAFFLQSYAVQTHIHGAPLSPPSIAGQITKSNGTAIGSLELQSGGGHAPSPTDPNDCPLCQAAVHATGLFSIIPTAIAPSAMYFTSALPIFSQTIYALYRGHDKEQRGPPSV